MDARTDEVRSAHDRIAEFYAEVLPGMFDELPVDQAVLTLFATLVLGGDAGVAVADVGCGPGWLEPRLAARGLAVRGVDLSPEMVRVARRDHPGFRFDVADVRDLPFADVSLAGVVCWYSLMYLDPADRPTAYGELARVLRPGGHLAIGFKEGDDSPRRGGQRIGVEFDIWWMSFDEVRSRLVDAGFEIVFHGGRPASVDADQQPQGYVIARRGDGPSSLTNL